MDRSQVWSAIHAEREALARDLEPLTQEQWATPSLCLGWSVRDVLAHMTATARKSVGKFLGDFVGAGFRMNKMESRDIVLEKGAAPSETLSRFRSVTGNSLHPPGPVDVWLGETVVHGCDIRRPLGIEHAYDPAVLIRVADSYKRSNLIIGAKKRIAGLGLKANDAEWASGDGPGVVGPMASLLMAMAGRSVAIDDLTGEGVATLRSRS